MASPQLILLLLDTWDPVWKPSAIFESRPAFQTSDSVDSVEASKKNHLQSQSFVMLKTPVKLAPVIKEREQNPTSIQLPKALWSNSTQKA